MHRLPTSLFKKGVRVVIGQPEVPRQGHKLKSFGIGFEKSGWQGTVKPTRLEVRRNMRATNRNYDPELLPRAEAGSSAQSISDLRKHLARAAGTTYKPTGSVSNSPYDLRGGNLGVPSYGVRGAPRESKKALLRAARTRATRRRMPGVGRGPAGFAAAPIAYGIAGAIKTRSLGGVKKGLDAWMESIMPSDPSKQTY